MTSPCEDLFARQGVTRAQGWFESHKLALVVRIAELADSHPEIFPEQVVAETTCVDLSKAMLPFKRADALTLMPQLSPALTAGEVSADHVDVVARAADQLRNGSDRQRFADRGEFLIGVASRTTPTDFARTVRTELQRAQRDDDGIERLHRQQRATSLRTWTDQVTGMWHLRGEFDPETGLKLHRRLQATVEKLFHDSTPPSCPTDPLRKQDHLRALALVAVTDGRSATVGDSAEISILIDAQTLADGSHAGTIVDCGIPLQLPVESIRRMLCTAKVTPIVVNADQPPPISAAP